MENRIDEKIIEALKNESEDERVFWLSIIPLLNDEEKEKLLSAFIE